MSEQEEPAKKKHVPWYNDKTALHEALARAFSGYNGKLVKRWHVIPIAIKRSIYVYKSNGKVMFSSAKAVGLATPNGQYISKLVRRMQKLCAADYPLKREGDFTYIAYDVVDATGAVFPFEMTYHYGSADAGTGFFAAVWDRATGNELGYASRGSDSNTAVHWEDKEVIERYVPHERLGPKFDEAELEECGYTGELALFHDEFDCLHTDIETTHSDDKKQLELLIGVAAEMSHQKNNVFFPSIVPDDVIAEARANLFGKLISRLSPEILELIWSYREWRIFLDHDVDFPRLDYKDTEDNEEKENEEWEDEDEEDDEEDDYDY